MLKTIFCQLTLAVLLLSGDYLRAQNDSVQLKHKFKNEISSTFLGQNFFYSVNYTTLLHEKGKRGLFQQFSYTYLKEFPKVLSYSLYKEFGMKSHHLMAGVGYLYRWEYQDYQKSTNHYLGPHASLGYTFSNPNRRFKLGVHLNLFFGNDYNSIYTNVWGGLTLGYKFNVPNILKILEKIPEQPGSFRFETGYEGGIGTGKLAVTGIGKTNSICVSNALFVKYYLKHVYLKGSAGVSVLSKSQVDNDDNTVNIFSQDPYLVHVGLGIGCPVVSKGKLTIYPETEAGMYAHVPQISFSAVNSAFETFTDFSSHVQTKPFLFGDRLYHESSPWYFKTGVYIDNSITAKFAVNYGIYYSYSLLGDLVYNHDPEISSYPEKKITYKDWGFRIGLHFKL